MQIDIGILQAVIVNCRHPYQIQHGEAQPFLNRRGRDS